MSNNEAKTRPRSTRHEFGRVLSEAAVVGAVGLGVALIANQVSPRGLSLTRDYFPGSTASPQPASSETGPSDSTDSAATPPERIPETAPNRLAEKGLTAIEHETAVALFRDPGYGQETIVFVDARNADHYRAGHVPGAYQFDHYYPENHLPEVLPACQNAETIVVYCEGGECEDSEFAALTLVEAGVSADQLRVYVGGITEWSLAGLPVEAGERNSGDIRADAP